MDPELEPDFAAAEAGFTLIELLVSIAILAVLALGLTLALPQGGTRGDSDMARFQRQYDSLRQQAIAGQHSLGLVVDHHGMRQARRLARRQFEHLAPDQDSPPGPPASSTWQISAQALRWRGSVQLDAPVATGQELPQIQFLGDGRSSAFVISFRPRAGGTLSGRCRSDGWTGLRCENS